jgi:hypothetical protein
VGQRTQQGRPWATVVRNARVLDVVAVVTIGSACSGPPARREQTEIRSADLAAVKKVLLDDAQAHREGLRKAAVILAPGFARPEAVREKEMRAALKVVQKPPKGVPELFASPATVLAAVGPDGTVIARDAEPDRMKGAPVREWFSVVARALDSGVPGEQVGEFPSTDPSEKPSVSWVFVEPVVDPIPARGARPGIVGALLLGTPLWRVSQQLSKQLQLDHAKTPGVIVWVYVYRGAVLHHFGTPPDLDTMIPDAMARSVGLARSPNGYTGAFQQFGRWYGYGVVPLSLLGPDAGVIIVRSNP